MLRGIVVLVVVAALAPAMASAQTPGLAGYSGTAPTTASGTGEPSSGTAPAAAAPDAPAQVVDAPTSTLPFTGLQIAFMLAAGLGLVGLGVALRRASRPALPVA